MKKSTIGALIGGAAVTAAAIAAPVLLRQQKKLSVSRLSYRSEKIFGALGGYRIAHVADFHNCEIGKRNELLIAQLQVEQPDRILISGDFIDSLRPNLPLALSFIDEAVQIAPCDFVTGNHEHRLEPKQFDALLQALRERGVQVLRNEAVRVYVGEEQFRLIGVDCQEGKTATLRDLMRNRPANEFNILLSHKPHYAEHYTQSGVDLVFCGHAHGGQFRLPKIGGLYAPGQGILPRYTEGMYQIGGTTLCVSRGLGNSSFPFRVGNPPELVIVTLQPKESP